MSHDDETNDEAEGSVPEPSATRIYRDDDDIGEFFAQFAGSGFQYGISRLEPKSLMVRGKVQQIRGHLETLMQPPTLDQIRDAFGGGQYLIRVSGPRPGAKGIKFITTARVQIAGDPKPIELDATADGEDRSASPALVAKVLDATLDEKRRADARLERANHSAGPDNSLLKTTLETIERSRTSQVETMREQLERRDRELAELRQQRSPFEHPDVIKALFTRSNDDGGREADAARRELENERQRNQRDLEAERERNQRERENERERNQRELASERERATRELAGERERRERDQRDFAQERERLERELKSERERLERDLAQERRERDSVVQSIERTHRSEVENLKMAQAQIMATKDDHLVRLQDELRTLRETAKPQDTLSELQRLGEVANVVKSFAPLGGGNGKDEKNDDEPKSAFDRVIEIAPILLDKFVQPQRPQPAPTSPRPAPVQAATPRMAQRPVASQQRRPVPAPTWSPAMASVPRPTQPFPRPPAPARVAPSRTPVAAPPARVAPSSTAAPAVIPPPSQSPTEPAAAPSPLPAVTLPEGIAFLEQALTAGKSPAEIAPFIRARLGDVATTAWAAMGPDVMFSQLEEAAPDSLLVSAGGKRFIRELVNALGARHPDDSSNHSAVA